MLAPQSAPSNTSNDGDMQRTLMNQLDSPSPQASPANMAPQDNTPPNVGTSEPDGMHGVQNQQQNPQIQALQQKLDGLPNDQKAFLAQYMVPEFIHAVGLISGPEVAQYLSQYANPDKVLVPVNRQEAQRIQEAVKQQQGQGAGQPAPQQAQGQPQPAPQQPQRSPQAQPMATAQAQPQQLPNGVTPAPMQHGIMAPQA